MSWGEAVRLTQILATDPSSQIAAAIAGWAHPLERIDATLRDLYDLQHASKSKKRPKPYPRPWDMAKKRAKPSASLSQEEIIAALRMAGHTAPIPTRPKEA